jgi:hypothetical protein
MKRFIEFRAICVVGFGPKKSYHMSKRCKNKKKKQLVNEDTSSHND